MATAKKLSIRYLTDAELLEVETRARKLLTACDQHNAWLEAGGNGMPLLYVVGEMIQFANVLLPTGNIEPFGGKEFPIPDEMPMFPVEWQPTAGRMGEAAHRLFEEIFGQPIEIRSGKIQYPGGNAPPRLQRVELLREAIRTIPPRASEAATETEPAVVLANDARDKWLYELAMKSVPWETIRLRLIQECQSQGWDTLDSVNGVKSAANRYAERNGEPPIPRRQRGRPAAK